MGNGFLIGTKVVEEHDSFVNGTIKVIKSLGFGTYIQVGGLTQSGGVVTDVWRTTLRKVKSKKEKVKGCLILGFGGGSAAGLVRKYWPEAKITGVDIDSVMVELGRKYLGLKDYKTEIVIADAYGFCRKLKTKNGKFDLILVDTYCGDIFPKKFESDSFIRLIFKLLSKEGIAVFNRLYYGEKRSQAMRLMKKLGGVIGEKNVMPLYPQANIMFICKN